MSAHGALPLWTADALRGLPAPASTPAGCPCAALRCAGWESVPAPVAAPLLQAAGSLCDPALDEPTVAEWPARGGYWAADAPIAPRHFPYNRCTVWSCTGCGRGFLQYTEFGGYYVDHRLRAVDPGLVVDDAAPPHPPESA